MTTTKTKEVGICSVPGCKETGDLVAWEVSGMKWFSCPEHIKEVAKIVARVHVEEERRAKASAESVVPTTKWEEF